MGRFVDVAWVFTWSLYFLKINVILNPRAFPGEITNYSLQKNVEVFSESHLTDFRITNCNVMNCFFYNKGEKLLWWILIWNITKNVVRRNWLSRPVKK